MSPFVESLARLYKAKKVTKKKLELLLEQKKLTQAEFKYICS